MKKKWSTMFISLGGVLICTSPLLNKQMINILMGLTLIVFGVYFLLKK